MAHTHIYTPRNTEFVFLLSLPLLSCLSHIPWRRKSRDHLLIIMTSVRKVMKWYRNNLRTVPLYVVRQPFFWYLPFFLFCFTRSTGITRTDGMVQRPTSLLFPNCATTFRIVCQGRSVDNLTTRPSNISSNCKPGGLTGDLSPVTTFQK